MVNSRLRFTCVDTIFEPDHCVACGLIFEIIDKADEKLPLATLIEDFKQHHTNGAGADFSRYEFFVNGSREVGHGDYSLFRVLIKK